MTQTEFDVTPEALDWAISFIEKFEDPSSRASTMHLGEGAFPWVELSAVAENFTKGLRRNGLVIVFDWPSWQETARRYVEDPELLAKASLEDCLKLLTTHVRADRFAEGHVAAMLENGHIPAVLKRIRDIRQRSGSTSSTRRRTPISGPSA